MSTNIEKFKTEERIRISYLKHGGNALAVAEELELDLKYVRKVAKKFRRAQKHDIARLVSNDISTHVLMGMEQRKQLVSKKLSELQDKDKAVISTCCGSFVSNIVEDGEHTDGLYVCSECNNTCKITTVDKDNIHKLMIEYINELRKDDELLVDFAEKMGYTNRDAPIVQKNTQYNFTLNKKAKEIDDDVKQRVESLPPAEREKLRKSIQAEITNDDEKQD